MTYSEIISELFRIYTSDDFKDVKNMKIIMEVIGTKSLSYELANEQRRRGTWLPITEIKHQSNSKEARIRALKPFYEYGHVWHIKECPQIEELEDELLHFPRGKHDDLIDPFSTIVQYASPPTHKAAQVDEGPSRKRLLTYKPRSPITGV
jgi:predicted phage terminase large subunit-like protein